MIGGLPDSPAQTDLLPVTRPAKAFPHWFESFLVKVRAFNPHRHQISKLQTVGEARKHWKGGGRLGRKKGEELSAAEKPTPVGTGLHTASFALMTTLRGRSYFTYFKAQKKKIQKGGLVFGDHM